MAGWSSLRQPLAQEDFDYSEQHSGLRSTLEQKISALSKHRTPTLFFIGDSLIRIQATVACAVVQEKTEIDPELALWRKHDHHCKGRLGEVVFGWSAALSPSELKNLQKEFSTPDPDFVMWDAGFWEEHGDGWEENIPKYTKLAKKTMHAYAKAAPNAELKIFLTHRPCNEAYRKIIKTYNDIQMMAATGDGISVKIADGWSFTANLGCGQNVTDGKHFPKYVFEELLMSIEA